MILGILSDSHGRHRRTARAIRLLQGLGAEALVHCGDLGSEAVLDELVGLRVWFVWGNTDSVGPLLRNYARVLGLPVPETIPLRLELAGRSIAVFHGHEPQFTDLARRIQHHLGRVTSPDIAARHENPRRIFGATLSDCDYILYGHSHKATDARVCRVRPSNIC